MDFPAYIDYKTRVRYVETDRMGVAHHSSYFVWFEIGRTEFCRASGFAYAKMEEEDHIWMVVVEAWCRYKAPVTYDDVIIIRTRIGTVSQKKLKFVYEIFKEGSQKPIATGFTLHLPVGTDGKRTKIPKHYLDLLEGFASKEINAKE